MVGQYQDGIKQCVSDKVKLYCRGQFVECVIGQFVCYLQIWEDCIVCKLQGSVGELGEDDNGQGVLGWGQLICYWVKYYQDLL